jgi:hypothetical protein
MPPAEEPVLLTIPVASIRVMEGRKRTFNAKDERLQIFVDSIKKEGVVHPICVRKAASGDGYELVAGRKRLWASKQLGRETIPATVRQTPDSEAVFISRIENFCRGHLDPAQQALELQGLLKEYENIYGSDPGKSASGAAGLSKVESRLGQKGFKKKSEPTPDIIPPMLSDSVSLSIGEAKPDADSSNVNDKISAPQPQAFSSILANESGMNQRSAQRQIKIAKTFSQDQLTVLALCDATQEELLEIAGFNDPARVERACRSLVLHNDVRRAIEESAVVPPEPVLTPEEKKEVDEKKMDDKTWLKVVCGPFRERLQNTSAYDRDALFYRHDQSHRGVHRLQAKHDLLKGREKGYSPLINQTIRVLFVEHPRNWLLCAECLGENNNKPNCGDCGGCGYRIKQTNLPKRS